MPLDRWLGRRRMRGVRSVGGVTAIVIVLLLIVLDRQGLLLYDGGDLKVYDGKPFLVSRVVDGDTLDVAYPDGQSVTTRIRLWGVDTPERARASEHRAAEPFAEEATAYARELAQGQMVRLVLEPHRVRDKYRRVLAFVELPDGTLLNERLIMEGLAVADGQTSHRYVERFGLLELQAKGDGRGMWGTKKKR